MRKSDQPLSLYIVFAIIGVLLSGCSNSVGQYTYKASPTSYNPSYYGGTPTGSPSTAGGTVGFNCPASANVVPDYDSTADGSNYFTVCPSTANQTDILIHGRTSSSGTICVYPALSVDPQHIYPKLDPNTLQPLYQCVQVTNNGAFASFTTQSGYNAAFIVESPNQGAMLTCLSTGNSYFCPRYSFGSFR